MQPVVRASYRGDAARQLPLIGRARAYALDSGGYDDVTLPALWTICGREGKEVRRRVGREGMLTLPGLV
jgi:hypothetical protein